MVHCVVLENLLLLAVIAETICIANLIRAWNVEQCLRWAADSSIENWFNSHIIASRVSWRSQVPVIFTWEILLWICLAQSENLRFLRQNGGTHSQGITSFNSLSLNRVIHRFLNHRLTVAKAKSQPVRPQDSQHKFRLVIGIGCYQFLGDLFESLG